MKTTRFDLEQDILKVWSILDDIDMVATSILDSPFYEGIDPKHADTLHNQLTGIKHVYEMRLNKLWETFEHLVHTDRLYK